MPLRVLTWNLFHGRSKPETPRSLLPEFAAMLGGWEWDVALLQEVLPWWPAELARASGASMRMALTSRHVPPGLPPRLGGEHAHGADLAQRAARAAAADRGAPPRRLQVVGGRLQRDSR